MSALAILQRDFAEALHDEDRPCAFAGPGMAVYRHTYRAQLLACMEESFPMLRAWLGPEDFARMAIAYALAHPPQSWSLDHFPGGFSVWLDRQTTDRVTVDLARIEWALAECFIAPDEPVLTSAAIATIDWDSAQLAPIRASRLLHLGSNALAVWLAMQEGGAVPEIAETRACILIWRQREQCHLREVDALEARVLDGRRFVFGELCAAVCAQLGDEAGVAHAGSLLAGWAAAGVLVVVLAVVLV